MVLSEQTSREPEWNFYKYLVDVDGTVLNAWGTRTDIEEIFNEVQDAVNQAKSKKKSESADAGKETVVEEPESVDHEEL